MRKRFLPFLALSLALVLLFTGCGQSAPAKPKELTISEVLNNSSAAAEKVTGTTFSMDMTQTMNMGGSSLATTMNMDMTTTKNPLAVHAVGKVNMLGQSMPMEIYMVDNTMYEQVMGHWMKLKGMNLNQLGLSQNQTSDSIKKLNDVLAALGKDSKGMTMVKKNGVYTVTLDSSSVKDNQKILDLFMKEVQGSMKGLDSMMGPNGAPQNLLKGVKIEQIKQVIVIDEKTFEVKSVDQQMKMSMSMQGKTFTTNQHIVVTVKGPFTGTITVPADVVKQAKSMK